MDLRISLIQGLHSKHPVDLGQSFFFFREEICTCIQCPHGQNHFFFRLVQILSARVNKDQNLSCCIRLSVTPIREEVKTREACDWQVMSVCWYWAPSLLKKRGSSLRGQRLPLLSPVSIYLYPSAVHL